MKTKKFLLIATLVALALAFTFAPAAAGSTRIEVETFEVKCFYDPGHTWVSDGIYHARDGYQIGYRIALSPEDPIQEVVRIDSTVNLNLNTKTGKGTGWGTFTSDSFEGSWTGKLIEWMPGIWVISGKSVGHGVNPPFEGWQLRNVWESIDPAWFPGFCDGDDPVSALYTQVTYHNPGR